MPIRPKRRTFCPPHAGQCTLSGEQLIDSDSCCILVFCSPL